MKNSKLPVAIIVATLMLFSFTMGLNVNDNLVASQAEQNLSNAYEQSGVLKQLLKKIYFKDNFEPSVSTEEDHPKYLESELLYKADEILRTKYPFEQPSAKDKEYGLIKGLVESYNDPYTVFLKPEDTEDLFGELNGSFYGIGVEITAVDDKIVVVSPLKGTPAFKAGIQPQDIIYEVDGTPVSGSDMQKAVSLIRGKKGTTVKLGIIRNGTPITIEVERDKIDIPTANAYSIDDIYIIELYTFGEDSDRIIRDELIKFKEGNYKALLLDLRGNPGGFLDKAVSIASMFLPKGSLVVTEDYGEGKKEDKLYTKQDPILPSDVPMFVLINSGSASASEIVSGALQDYGRAKVIGIKSFGKGSVQELVPLDKKGAAIKVTVAYWLTPSGRNINKEGIVPDIDLEKEYTEFIKSDKNDSTNQASLTDRINGNTEAILSSDYILRRALEIIKS